MGAEIQKLMKSYIQYAPRKLQSLAYTGPITISNYQKYQLLKQELQKKVSQSGCQPAIENTFGLQRRLARSRASTDFMIFDCPGESRSFVQSMLRSRVTAQGLLGMVERTTLRKWSFVQQIEATAFARFPRCRIVLRKQGMGFWKESLPLPYNGSTVADVRIECIIRQARTTQGLYPQEARKRA